MINSLLHGRIKTLLSLLEGIIFIALWDSIKSLLSPLETNTLTIIIMIIALMLIIALTWLAPTFMKYKILKNDVLQYNPNHFEDKEYEKLFNNEAKKREKTHNK